ncbi:hypothetical protein L1987_44282 [Smallanthus sonchifolius]|uniref:Uncharacterized protein n=1 Tax=Smallanthus sonchifolius TaxID=185202 RepID=A0ACB9GNF2_9ASTR|nr:hypothetical protein L1987_44282 [Smallanthus sonchifolius]
MKSITSNNINDNNDSNKNSDNWLGFSLSPHSSEVTHPSPSTFFTLPSTFNYQNIYYGGVEGVNGGGIYSAFPTMPLKSDGSLGFMDAITRSQSQGMVASTTPKLENFFGGVTMGNPDLENSTMYYHQNFHIQPQNYQDYSGLYPTVQQQEAKIVADTTCGLYLPCIGEGWISNNYHSGDGGLQSLRLSMSPGCSQSSSCVTVSQQQVTPDANNVTETVVMDTKKRGSLKVNQHKQIVHRKSLDTFGQRTSQYRGVTRHRWTGGYDMEEKAARAYDLAALKYWGPSTHINFPVENYEQELEEMKNMSRQEYVAHLRRRSSGFSRGASIYRGVTRSICTQEDAAEAYDVAAIKFRGINAVTNFDITRYNVERIMESNTLLAGELARRTKDPDPTNQVLPSQPDQNGEPKTIANEPTSMSGSKAMNTWIPTAMEPAAPTQVRSQVPIFAAWTDA